MNYKAIAIYCFLADFLQNVGWHEDPHTRFSDAQVLTTALMSALFFFGNHQPLNR